MNLQLQELFKQEGFRLTASRLMIFNVLKSFDEPVSIVAIIKACPGIDKVSIYRTISLFVRLRIVGSVPHGWKQLYELAAPFVPHHHHLVCETCGNMTEIHSKNLESIIINLTREHHFKVLSHHFEVTGLCENCQ